MKFKQFLKAKKGKELIEIIIMTPIMVFLIMYSAINVTCYILRAQVEDNATTYTRSAVTERSLYNALCSIADDMTAKSPETTVLEIAVVSKEDGSARSISFSDNDNETTYFKNLVYTDRYNKTAFNINVSDNFAARYYSVNEYWQRGNYITIKVQRGLNPVINSISKVSIYNWTTHEDTTLSYGADGIVECDATSIIIS